MTDVFSWILGPFPNSDICGRDLRKHCCCISVSLDHPETESKETLTENCVQLVIRESVVVNCDHALLIFHELGTKVLYIYDYRYARTC